MSEIKDLIRQCVEEGNYELASETLRKNLGREIAALREDVEYCILSAHVFLQSQMEDIAFELITIGLMTDPRSYELYLLLGEYYSVNNLLQAWICFEWALFYCCDEADRQVIEAYISDTIESIGYVSKLSIIIAGTENSTGAHECVESIKETIPPEICDIEFLSNEPDAPECILMNHAIKETAPYNDVLIVDPLTIFTENALLYLLIDLYSDKSVGAVEGLTNKADSAVAGQEIDLGGRKFGEISDSISQINAPMKNATEKKALLSGQALLISRKVLDRIGLIDEEYSTITNSLRDYCVKMNLEGLSCLLCYNSFWYRVDKGDKVDNSVELHSDKERFRSKWGIDLGYMGGTREELIELINRNEDDSFEVLELGCSLGGTLNRIKYRWPNACIHGVEYDEKTALLGSHIADIIQGDVEQMQIPYEKEQFDYIICADVLEHLRNPDKTIERFMPYLKQNGYFIISLPNIRYFAVLQMLLQSGRFDYADSGILDRTHLKFYTKTTATEMINSCGLEVVEIREHYNRSKTDGAEFINAIKDAIHIENPEEISVFQYYFLARKL